MMGLEMFLDGLLVLFLTIFFTQLVQRNAQKLGMVDVPNNRSSHETPTPRGAGIAIFSAFMIDIVLFHGIFFMNHLGFFLALILVFILGLFDDFKDASPKIKMLVIILATALIFFVDGLEIKTLGHWFGFELELPYLLSLLVTLFAVAGFTNALNLVDGLDGLAGSISLVILASLFYVGYAYHDEFIMMVSFLVIVALAGFLLFNWYPATIFMGDSGSLVLGFIISALSIRAINYMSDSTILFIAAVPIIDTIIVMTRRIQRGFSPFSPDKSHFHHKILMLKGSVDASVHILVSLQIILSTIGLLLRDKSDVINLMLFVVILFVFFQALDDRKEHRNLLFISQLKLNARKFVQVITRQKSIYLSFTLMLLALFIKIIF